MSFSSYSSLNSFSFSHPSLKPLIILNPDQDFLNEKWKLKYPDAAQLYYESLIKEGANVIVLQGYDQNYDNLLSLVDGWLIPGGLDIDPKKYNAQRQPNTVSLDSHELRYNFEHEMYSKIPKNLPVFGICYGSQLLNVLNGKKP